MSRCRRTAGADVAGDDADKRETERPNRRARRTHKPFALVSCFCSRLAAEKCRLAGAKR